MKNFIIKMLTRNGGISSKRVCGVLGWIICLIMLVYAIIRQLSIPGFADTVIISSAALLGVESVTNIFNKE